MRSQSSGFFLHGLTKESQVMEFLSVCVTSTTVSALMFDVYRIEVLGAELSQAFARRKLGVIQRTDIRDRH